MVKAENSEEVVDFYKSIMTNCSSKLGKERGEGVRELLIVKSGRVNRFKVQ